MIIVTLKGDASTGKTTTIKKVIAKLLNDGAEILWESHGITEASDMVARCSKRGEIAAVLKYRKKVVAVTTCGDYPKKIAAELVRILMYWDNSIDMFLCASHSVKQVKAVLQVSLGNKVLYSPSACDFKPNEIVNLNAEVQKRYERTVNSVDLIVVLPKKAAKSVALEKDENNQSSVDMFNIVKDLL